MERPPVSEPTQTWTAQKHEVAGPAGERRLHLRARAVTDDVEFRCAG